MNDYIWRHAYLWHWTPSSAMGHAINGAPVPVVDIKESSSGASLSIASSTTASTSAATRHVSWNRRYQRRRAIDGRWGISSTSSYSWQAHASYVSCLAADKVHHSSLQLPHLYLRNLSIDPSIYMCCLR
jgi:hypothetical protein